MNYEYTMPSLKKETESAGFQVDLGLVRIIAIIGGIFFVVWKIQNRDKGGIRNQTTDYARNVKFPKKDPAKPKKKVRFAEKDEYQEDYADN